MTATTSPGRCVAVHPRTGQRCQEWLVDGQPHSGPSGAEHWHPTAYAGSALTCWPLDNPQSLFDGIGQ